MEVPFGGLLLHRVTMGEGVLVHPIVVEVKFYLGDTEEFRRLQARGSDLEHSVVQVGISNLSKKLLVVFDRCLWDFEGKKFF